MLLAIRYIPMEYHRICIKCTTSQKNLNTLFDALTQIKMTSIIMYNKTNEQAIKSHQSRAMLIIPEFLTQSSPEY
mgnify:CR=1 FL=1